MALYRTGLYVKNHAVEQVQVAKTPIASYNGNVTGLYIPEIIAEIVARQAGSGTPAPDNIRPIIGVSECNVVRCGKNIWSYGDVSGTKRVAVEVDIKAGTYTVSANVTSSDTNANFNLILFYYADGTSESFYINRGTRQSVTVTLTNDVTSINFYASRNNAQSDGDTFSFTDIQLEVGSTATAYEAYHGNTYTIQLGDTYYGGELDVTNGVLTVTDVNIASYNGESINEPWICSEAVYSEGTTPPIGSQVVYPLATPITVQLTPTQVEQLLNNTVWADTGDVAVKFYNVIR